MSIATSTGGEPEHEAERYVRGNGPQALVLGGAATLAALVPLALAPSARRILAEPRRLGVDAGSVPAPAVW